MPGLVAIAANDKGIVYGGRVRSLDHPIMTQLLPFADQVLKLFAKFERRRRPRVRAESTIWNAWLPESLGQQACLFKRKRVGLDGSMLAVML